MNARPGAANVRDEGRMVRAYLECALWSSTGDDDAPLDRDYDLTDFDASALESARATCDAFYTAHAVDLATNTTGRDDLTQAGHYLWLTRNGHGAGFWDGDYPDEPGKRLTDAAHALGESDCYVGDDGRVYLTETESERKARP